MDILNTFHHKATTNLTSDLYVKFLQEFKSHFFGLLVLYNKLYPTPSGMKIKTLCFANYSMLCNEVKIPKTLTTQVTFGVNA